MSKKFFGLDKFNLGYNLFDDWDDDYYIELSPENEQLYDELAEFISVDELDSLIYEHGEEILKDLYKEYFLQGK